MDFDDTDAGNVNVGGIYHIKPFGIMPTELYHVFNLLCLAFGYLCRSN